MGLNVTLKPNYDDFSCQFSFGLTPPPQETDEVFTTPCFSQCPSKKRPAPGADAGLCPSVMPNATSPATPSA